MQKVTSLRSPSSFAGGDGQENAAQRRRAAEPDGSLVTATMLETTNINIQNPEHSRIATAILRKKPTLKTKNELIFLQEAFHGIDFFERMRNELKPEDFLLLIRQLKFETFEAGDTIFNLGDWGEHFYIIISGSVYILLKKHHEIAKESDYQTPRTAVQGNEKSKGSNDAADQKRVFTDDMDDDAKLEIIKSEYPAFFLGRIMQTGASFGEIALQNRVRRYILTPIVQPSNSKFVIELLLSCAKNALCLEHLTEKIITGYYVLFNWDTANNLFIVKIYKNKDEENLEFLRTFNLFAHLQNSRLNEIYLQLQKKTFTKNYTFYKEGQKPDNIYFIISGEVELSKAIQTGEVAQTEEPNDPGIKQVMAKLFMRNSEYSKTRKVRVLLLVEKLGSNYDLKVRPPTKRKLLWNGRTLYPSNRTSTATVSSSNCEVFAIAYDVFIKLVTDKGLINIAKQNVEKRSWMVDRISSHVAKVDEAFTKDIKPPIFSPAVKASPQKTVESYSSTKETPASHIENKEKKIFTSTDKEGFLRSRYSRKTICFDELNKINTPLKTESTDPKEIQSPSAPKNRKLFTFLHNKQEELLLSRKQRARIASMKGLPISKISSNQDLSIEKPKEEGASEKKQNPRNRLRTAPSKQLEQLIVRDFDQTSPEDPSVVKSPYAKSPKSIDFSPFLQPKFEDSPTMSIRGPLTIANLPSQITRPATLQNISSSPKVSLGTKNNNKDTKEFKSMWKGLKKDKLFQKEKDTMDTIVSHGRSISLNQFLNHDASPAQKNLKKVQKDNCRITVGSYIYNSGFTKIQSPKTTKPTHVLYSKLCQYLVTRK